MWPRPCPWSVLSLDDGSPTPPVLSDGQSPTYSSTVTIHESLDHDGGPCARDQLCAQLCVKHFICRHCVHLQVWARPRSHSQDAVERGSRPTRPLPDWAPCPDANCLFEGAAQISVFINPPPIQQPRAGSSFTQYLHLLPIASKMSLQLFRLNMRFHDETAGHTWALNIIHRGLS